MLNGKVNNFKMFFAQFILLFNLVLMEYALIYSQLHIYHIMSRFLPTSFSIFVRHTFNQHFESLLNDMSCMHLEKQSIFIWLVVGKPIPSPSLSTRFMITRHFMTACHFSWFQLLFCLHLNRFIQFQSHSSYVETCMNVIIYSHSKLYAHQSWNFHT